MVGLDASGDFLQETPLAVLQPVPRKRGRGVTPARNIEVDVSGRADLTDSDPQPFKRQMNLPPFQRLVDDHSRSLHRFLCGMVGQDAADDCLQETLLAALLSYGRLRHDRNLRGWLFTIAHRKGIDHLRKRSREQPFACPPDQPSQPEAVRDAELWSRVARLPEKQRAAVTLRYLGDLAYADVARIMAISEPAARQNVRAGLASLRKDYR